MSLASHFRAPKLLVIAWPIFVEQALRILIGTVDTFMVSHVSDGAVAALGVANQVIALCLIIFNFIGIGASIVLTHHLGARDRSGAAEITKTAIGINTWVGVLASGFVVATAGPMLKLMQLPENLMPYALPFLTLMGGSLFLEAMSMSISAVLRANRHTREAMVVAVAQNILNVLGNYITLYGLFGCPKLGVLGVALSGVITRVFSCVTLWILLTKCTQLRLAWSDFVRFSRKKVRRILRIGLPAAGENLCYWLAFMLVTTFIARLGPDSLAVQSYALQVQRIVILFSVSIGLGTEIIIGHLIGAGELEVAYDEVLRSLRTGLLLATGAISIVALSAHWSMSLFTSNPAIIASGVMLLRMSVLLEPGRVFNIVIINALRATGDVGFPIRMAAISMWLVWVPLAWILGVKLGWGLPGIWLAMSADEWTRGVLMYRRWKLRRWVKHAERSRSQVRPVTGPAAEPMRGALA